MYSIWGSACDDCIVILDDGGSVGEELINFSITRAWKLAIVCPKGYVRTDAALINTRYNLDTVIPAEQSLSYCGLLVYNAVCFVYMFILLFHGQGQRVVREAPYFY